MQFGKCLDILRYGKETINFMGKINKQKLIFWLIILVGILIRIYNFPVALHEMNSDEIMTAVNAKSIADTGKELGGIDFPVYLQGWGGQSVVLLYLMSLSIKVIGYSLVAVRIPFIIVSIASMFVFYDLLRKISKSEKIALIGLALVSISPWHMLQSLWALDCNMFPHFLIMAIDMLYTGIKKNRNILTYISMVFFAITLYCYGVAIYFVPLFLVVIMLYLLKTKTLKIKNVAICAVVFLVFALPIITMFAINVLNTKESIELGILTIPFYEGLSRTKDMIFFTPNKLQQLGENIFSTLKVIFIQTDGAEWNSSKAFGATYRITILFTLIGLIKVIKNAKNKDFGSVMLLTWLSISVLTGLVVNKTNINRLNSIWYVLLMLAAFGIYYIYEKIKYKKTYKVVITVAYTAIFIAYCIYFYSQYASVVDNSGTFSRGFYQSLNYIKSMDETTVWYDNIKNDGCLSLYISFNKDNTKEYHCISNEEELKEKIKNIGENEVLILDVEFKQYENIKNSHQIGDFLIVTK